MLYMDYLYLACFWQRAFVVHVSDILCCFSVLPIFWWGGHRNNDLPPPQRKKTQRFLGDPCLADSLYVQDGWAENFVQDAGLVDHGWLFGRPVLFYKNATKARGRTA